MYIFKYNSEYFVIIPVNIGYITVVYDTRKRQTNILVPHLLKFIHPFSFYVGINGYYELLSQKH